MGKKSKSKSKTKEKEIIESKIVEENTKDEEKKGNIDDEVFTSSTSSAKGKKNVSNRDWKVTESKRTSANIPGNKALRPSWEKKQEERQRMKMVKLKEREMKENAQKEREEERERIKSKKRRREENIKSAIQVQVVSDPKKIRKLSKKQFIHMKQQNKILNG